MRTLAFAFKGTNSERILNQIDVDGLVKHYVSSSESAIQDFIEAINLEEYDGFLGLGLYTGRGRDQLRIERHASNQFRSKSPAVSFIQIPYGFRPNGQFKVTSGMGQSYCNLISYLLAQRLTDAASGQSYNFIHIPSEFDELVAANAITRQLTSTS